MDFDDRLITSEKTDSDVEQYSLRPRTLDEYIGQDKVKQNISVFIEAALKRWITCCCSGLRVLERQLWPIL